MKVIFLVSICCLMLSFPVIGRTLPPLNNQFGLDNTTLEELEATSIDDSAKNLSLYVVKAMVYEIGILTEEDNDTDNTSFENEERVDLTFFDAHSNNSHIDLGNIPLPIKTNVSGQILTGIAPINIGAFSSAGELLQTLPLTGTIFNITQSDTAFYQLTATNISDSDKAYPVNANEFASLAGVQQLFPSSSTISEVKEENVK
uniref:DUF4794 domain-containing protein n=1 Tax=Glossina austeni TaxID=7395 RepID=A0A1A9VHK2_GLOAU